MITLNYDEIKASKSRSKYYQYLLSFSAGMGEIVFCKIGNDWFTYHSKSSMKYFNRSLNSISRRVNKC